jgi:hypothetical protein
MSSGVDAESRVRLKTFYGACRVVKLYAATGNEFLRGLPREAKPFTRMAKWEIRFQRFAISFRPSALGLCRFRLPLAFSLQPLAFASGANEKFHLSPSHRCNDLDRQIDELGLPNGLCPTQHKRPRPQVV